MYLRRAGSPSVLIFLVLTVVMGCTTTPGYRAAPANAISVQFDQASMTFGFRAVAQLSDDGSLLVISGSAEDDSLSPSLQLAVESTNGPVTPGTYRLDTNPDLGISAQYAIERAEDGAIVTNTVFETRDLGNERDLIITIASLDQGRVSGSFSGLVTTDDEVTIANPITMADGAFDVRVESS